MLLSYFPYWGRLASISQWLVLLGLGWHGYPPKVTDANKSNLIYKAFKIHLPKLAENSKNLAEVTRVICPRGAISQL